MATMRWLARLRMRLCSDGRQLKRKKSASIWTKNGAVTRAGVS
jgi:hypothetical protein